jgi:hypothetical protein
MTDSIRKRREIVLLIVVLAPLLVLRVLKDAGAGPYGLDASLYTQNARHVANGDGLITTVSLYHHGYVLPVRTSVQPLWLLLLGYSARAIGMIEAATLLPRLFYVVDLLLMFLLVRVIAPRIGGRWAIVAPHAVVAVLGTNLMFFSSTTHPYREGVTYGFGLAALLAMHGIAERRSMVSALLAGLLAGLAFLGRLEFAAVGVGCVTALLICRMPVRLVAGYIAAAAVVVTPWILVLGYIPGLRWLGSWVERPRVAIPNPVPVALSSTEQLADWIRGALVMFRLGDPNSFTRTWGVVALLVPLAAIAALVGWLRTRELPLPRDLTTMATALTGLVIFIEVFFYRGGVFMHFMFGWRHGLVLALLMALAVPFLLAHRSAALRAVAAIAIVISIVTGTVAIVRFIRQPNLRYTPAEHALLRWLPPKTTVLTTRAETLGMLSEAYFHNTYCASPPETTRAYIDELRIDYVVVYDFDRRCRYAVGLGDVLAGHLVFGEGPGRIWLLKRKV